MSIIKNHHCFTQNTSKCLLSPEALYKYLFTNQLFLHSPTCTKKPQTEMIFKAHARPPSFDCLFRKPICTRALQLAFKRKFERVSGSKNKVQNLIPKPTSGNAGRDNNVRCLFAAPKYCGNGTFNCSVCPFTGGGFSSGPAD
jgi:hypothetical protein